jgi:predicted methyltransferase
MEIQEFMLVPHGFDKFSEALRCGAEIFHNLKKILAKDGYTTAVGDEGGFAPKLSKNEDALGKIIEAIEAAGYKPGVQVSLALDCAISEYYNRETKKYTFDGQQIDNAQLVEEYVKMVAKYPIVSIEDGLDENDRVAVMPFSPPDSSNLGEAESVDMVLTFRNVHGWLGRGLAEDNFKEFSRVLKPGGVLGVVQHRADAGSDLEVVGPTGYIPEEVVIDLARQAGLYLEARSEVNANPADDHDHESGVWTLPPAVRLCQEIEDEAEKEACAQPWREIGESDRMTLRFRKPMD